MAYRALISIVQGDDRRDYRIALDENFKNGEELAHVLSECRTFGKAIFHLAGGLAGPALVSQAMWDDRVREDWVSEWADQTWVVTFDRSSPDSIFSTVRIDGNNSFGSPIFMRRTTYSIQAGD